LLREPGKGLDETGLVQRPMRRLPTPIGSRDPGYGVILANQPGDASWAIDRGDLANHSSW
jgi:hypothetical protein